MSKQIFTIAKLEDKDYLNLYKQFPNIKKEDLENSLGFADREAGEIFIRKSGNKQVDNNTILHEAQELFSETSEHEKDGIRFGWFRKAFGFSSQKAVNILAPILASTLLGPLGPIAAGLGGAATSAATQKLNTGNINPLQVGLSGLGGAALGSGMQAGVQGAKGLGSGYLGQLGAGLKTAIGITPAGMTKSATGGITPNIGKSTIMSGGPLETYAQGGSVLGQSLGNISKAVPATSSWVAPSIQAASKARTEGLSGLAAPMNAAPPATPQGLGSPWVAPQTPTVGAGAGAGTPAAPTTLWGKAGEALKNPMTQNILGVTSLAGSMAPKQPEFQMPSTVEDIRKKLLEQTQVDPITGEMKPGGLTEVGKQAQLELGNILKSTPSQINAPAQDAYYADTNRRIDLQYEQARKQLDAVYNNAGMLDSGEYRDQVSKLTEAQTNAKNAFMQSENQRRFEFGFTQKYQAIQTALGVDQNVLNGLLGLTGYDIDTASKIYQAKAADIEELRRALGTLGSELILRGTVGTGTQPTMN